MSAPLRVLFVCHYLHHVVGGAEIIARKVVEGLGAAGWSVDSAVLGGPDPVPVNRSLEWRLPFGLRAGSLRGKQFAIYAGSLGIDASAARQILRGVGGVRYDLVVVHDTVSAGAGVRVARALGVPMVCFVYEPLPRLSPVQHGVGGPMLRVLTARANAVIRDAVSHARHRIAASRDTQRRLEAFAPGPPSTVVYNSAPEPARHHGRGEGLLFVGRLSREKGFDLLLEAWRRCPNRPVLSIASLDGPMAGEARAVAASLPGLRLLPPVPPSGMAEVDARHQVVVAPSAWPDPLPGAVLEARAFGRALLVSRLGGIPEIVEGYRPVRLVDVESGTGKAVQELAEAMGDLDAWATSTPDPIAEKAFRSRHSLRTQMDGILGVLGAQLRSR